MDMTVDLVASSDSPRARARFIKLNSIKEVKQYRVKQRNYRLPDFNRMILDLIKLGWTHEKIAFLLPVKNASTVSEWARGGQPSYRNGAAFIQLWQELTSIERFPCEGEELTYKYKLGEQMDLLDMLDDVIDQLDEEIKK